MKLFPKIFKKRIGLAPGELVHTGEQKVDEIRISLIDYDEDNLGETPLNSIEEAYPIKDSKTVSWLNVDGLHDVSIMEKVGNHFNIHPLVMADTLNVHQRPKFEDFGDYIFITLKMISFDEAQNSISSEQVSMILGDNYVITFQERYGDVFESVRERIRKLRGRIRKVGADYLAYALIDAVIDHYYVVLEKISEKIESLEDEVVDNPKKDTLADIHHLKKNMTLLRRAVWPLREMASNLIRSESKLMKKQTMPFTRDLYDHTIQVTDSIDTFKDMLSGLMDLYLSNISNRMNEVMKVLTIFAAIFIPLTFIAGIYGMNFEFMPELKWKYSYPVLVGVMVCVTSGLIVYFRKKKWV
jgi:magnesium transporter